MPACPYISALSHRKLTPTRQLSPLQNRAHPTYLRPTSAAMLASPPVNRCRRLCRGQRHSGAEFGVWRRRAGPARSAADYQYRRWVMLLGGGGGMRRCPPTAIMNRSKPMLPSHRRKSLCAYPHPPSPNPGPTTAAGPTPNPSPGAANQPASHTTGRAGTDDSPGPAYF